MQALDESGDIGLVARRLEAEHRSGMSHGRERFGDATANPLRWRFRRDELGVRALDRAQLGNETIIRLIGNRGSPLDVVTLVVSADLGAE